MSTIDYSLETKQGKLFISFQGKEPDKALLKILGIEKKSMEPLQVPPGDACEVIALLSRSGRLLSHGKRLLFDPFTKLDFSIEIREIGEDRFCVEGFLEGTGKRDPIAKVSAIFPSIPPCVQNGPLLQKLSQEIDFYWLERVFPSSTEIDRTTLEAWILELEGEDASFITFPRLVDMSVPVWPVLKLADRFGAFADLWLDYGRYGEVGLHDQRHHAWRKKESERGWERDLLETDFQSKQVDSSHYYCPMDKVASSLMFLLEIGWKIIDHQGRRIYKQDGAKFNLEQSSQTLILRGKVIYGEYEADTAKIFGAFNRRDRFVELSPTSVGLLDPSSFPPDLDAYELCEGEVRLAKERLGFAQGVLLGEKGAERPDLLKLLSMARGEAADGEASKPAPDFAGVLHPYQQEGLQWLTLLHRQGLAGLLADEMGLGKTIQTLAFFSLHCHEKPLLIVVPTSLLFNWQREWEKFLPSRTLYVHNGVKRKAAYDELSQEQAILTSYALLRQDRELLTSLTYSTIVLDEAQTIKNPESQIAEIVCQLGGDFRLAITGTPLENRAEDLWSLFHFLLPGLLGERQEFRSKMSAAAADRRYSDQCKKLIRPFLLRRRKQVVADQLPEKLEQVVWVEMEESQRKTYEEMLAKSRKMLVEQESVQRVEILEKILRLRQICCHPFLVDSSQMFCPEESGKLVRLMEDLEEIVLQGGKALVYSQFTSMLSLISREIEKKNWKAAYLDGGTKDREQVVHQFQEDPETQIFLISLKAGGIGLNLTKADYVLLFDPWWNEAVERQAIDRAHRLGRKDPVIARRYVTALTIEEKIMRLKEHKNQLSGEILEQMDETKGFTTQELLTLFS